MYLFCYAAIWTFLNCINNFSDLLIGVLYVGAIKKKQQKKRSYAQKKKKQQKKICV